MLLSDSSLHEANLVSAAGGVGPAEAGGAGPIGAGGAGPAGNVVGGNVAPEVCGCTYETFLNCNPHTFSGTEGAVELSSWFEKLEIVFWISKCSDEDKGLPERIQRNVTSSKLVTTHEAIRMAYNLMDQVVRAKATRSNEANKRKWEDHQSGSNNNRNNNRHHQQNRRQEAVRAYAIAPVEGKVYAGNLPSCNRCKLHHTGPCTVKCRNCQRIGHQTKDCISKNPVTGSNTQQVVTCYGCGEKGHYRNKFPNKKDQSTKGAHGRAYVMRNGEPHEDPNVVIVQFEPHVLASKVKKAAKNHDPLALLAHSNDSSSQFHANSSYSPQPNYVTHPSSVVDYEEEYQGELQRDSQEDKLTISMINQAVIQDGRVEIQTKNAGYGGNGNRNVKRQNKNQAFNRTNVACYEDEAGSNLNDKENDFMLDNSDGDETLEELIATVIMMAQIQPANDNAESELSYDAKAVSEVNASNKVHEQVNRVKRETIIHTSDSDQIDSNIIFDDPYVENHGGTSEHDSNAHDEYHDIQMLAYNVHREAKNKKQLNNELKKQKELLQKELETFKDRVKTFKLKIIQCSKYKETCEELEPKICAVKDTIERILKEKDKIVSDFFKIENEKLITKHETQLAKKAFKERENQYLEDICDLEEKLSSHDRIVYKMGQYIQTIHMLRKKLNKVYDHFLKAGLGYKNPQHLKKAIAAQPKMYHGEMLHSTNLKIDSPNYEETLEDAEEIRLKMRNKMVQLNYGMLFMKHLFLNKNLLLSLRKVQMTPKISKPIYSRESKCLENDFKRSQAQSIDFELKLQHQKEKMACEVSWKSRLSTLNDENVLLKTQVDSVVQKRENIKLEFQKLFNSIEAQRTQPQKAVNELIEHVNQKTYAYADVRS
ncbi:integrase, catalytic region, zinc finger, CCHC-type containing protein [Tanacetum coccineum]|uniref:Integrase, catalytic region, zinc finger, CCHC-type containing protein n=1 Tax=Tanacetum coccineum TaxID=301880 RepID=A0ABQ5G0G9_9ASTR